MIKHKKKSAKNSTIGNIRIIAGKHRGRKLPVLMAEGLRPTTDRVKETVFNWLIPYVQDSRCLDCFAGSGSLGFEALSRGAKQVTFLELNSAAAKQLQANKSTLKADNVTILNTNALQYLQTQTQQYSLVFIDPPFRQNLVEQVAQLINTNALTHDAIIYVEMEKDNNQQQLPENWQLLKEKVAGQVVYQIYTIKQ